MVTSPWTPALAVNALGLVLLVAGAAWAWGPAALAVSGLLLLIAPDVVSAGTAAAARRAHRDARHRAAAAR